MRNIIVCAKTLGPQESVKYAAAAVLVTTNEKILINIYVREDARYLKSPENAALRDEIRPESGDIFAFPVNRAFGQRECVGDQVEQSCLSRPVRPDQTQDLALIR